MYASLFALLASLIYMPSIVLICSNAMKKMAKEQDKIGSFQTKMFIKVAIVELVTIPFIIASFIQLDQNVNENVHLYLLFLGVIVFGSLLYLFLEVKQINVELGKRKEPFPYLTAIFPISITLAFAVPIISFFVFIIQLSR